MTETSGKTGTRRPGKSDREARLKAALKSNMAKRKAQAKKRAASGRASGDDTPGGS